MNLMNEWKRTLFTLSLFSLSIVAAWAAELPTVPPREAGLALDRLEQIDHVMENQVAEGRMVGGLGLIAKQSKVAYLRAWGWRDREGGLAMTPDTIIRIFSMTKPITSMAAMILYEENRLGLDDPVSKFIPQLAGLEVLLEEETSGGETKQKKVSAREMTVRHLLTHTSGLTYGFFADAAVDKMYREAQTSRTRTLEDLIRVLSKLPLKYQPGSRWNYGYSTDVLGRVIEVVSGKKLDEFLEERIFAPLKMSDTGFYVPESKHSRLARLYNPGEAGKLEPVTPAILAAAGRRIRDFTRPTSFLSGGGGLASTAADYFRFSQMLLNGGEYGGARILTKESVALMTRDHLTGLSSEGRMFGLGFGIDVAPGGSGEIYGWGGAAGTRFWIDPAREMISIFATQIYPRGGERKDKFRDEFLDLAYQALLH